jgi:hypothetical protein
MAATATQPYTQRNRLATSAALVPPAMPWMTIQIHATRPRTRRGMRSQAGGKWPGAEVSGRSARTSRTSTKMNDSATVAAAPAR